MDHDSLAAVMPRLARYLADFDAVARSSVAKYQDYPPDVLIEHDPRAAASCIYSHMVAAAERQFDSRPEIKPLSIRNLKLWLIGEHTVIRWKKMDEDGKWRNYSTKQAKDYDRNLPLDGLPPAPTRVTVGYLLNRIGTEVGRVQIARPNGPQKIDWCAAVIQEPSRGTWAWEDVTKQARF